MHEARAADVRAADEVAGAETTPAVVAPAVAAASIEPAAVVGSAVVPAAVVSPAVVPAVAPTVVATTPEVPSSAGVATATTMPTAASCEGCPRDRHARERSDERENSQPVHGRLLLLPQSSQSGELAHVRPRHKASRPADKVVRLSSRGNPLPGLGLFNEATPCDLD